MCGLRRGACDMKLLYLPLHADEYPTGTLEAFCSAIGRENVRDFDYLPMANHLSNGAINRMLLEEIRGWRPDVVHMQLQETGIISAETLAAIRRLEDPPLLTTWMGDCRVSVPPYAAAVSAQCDVVFVSSVGQIESYRSVIKRPVRYWQIAADFARDFDFGGTPPQLPHIPAIVFSGRYYGPAFPDSHERLAVCRALASGLDFAVVGSGFPGDIPCLGEWPRCVQRWIYKQARLTIGVNNFNHIRLFYSERQVQAMASGTCHLCWRVPGLETEFVDGYDCVMFESSDECVALARRLLDDPVTCERIGRQGRARVWNEHSWPVAVGQYLRMIREFKPLP